VYGGGTDQVWYRKEVYPGWYRRGTTWAILPGVLGGTTWAILPGVLGRSTTWAILPVYIEEVPPGLYYPCT